MMGGSFFCNWHLFSYMQLPTHCPFPSLKCLDMGTSDTVLYNLPGVHNSTRCSLLFYGLSRDVCVCSDKSRLTVVITVLWQNLLVVFLETQSCLRIFWIGGILSARNHCLRESVLVLLLSGIKFGLVLLPFKVCIGDFFQNISQPPILLQLRSAISEAVRMGFYLNLNELLQESI